MSNRLHPLFLLLSLLFGFHSVMADAPPLPADLPAQLDFPNPLIDASGASVTTPEQWHERRAPELRRLFQHYEYGVLPPPPAKVDAKIDREDKGGMGGLATIRQVTLTWGMKDVAIHLLLVIPNNVTAPPPVFLGLNFNGNHALLNDPFIPAPDAATYPDKTPGAPEVYRGKQVDVWNIQQSVERGYAVASFFSGDVVPDRKDLADARLQLFQSGAGQSECATIAAWAWGLHRAVDYLVNDPAVNGREIAVVGHSRNGKTALLAAAMDERIAAAIPIQAGCGGTSPCRVSKELAELVNGRPTAETIQQINNTFPYWFCDLFKQFNKAPERLPFDQHELIALCAPRPVLVCAATEDLWANPEGQFNMVRLANPVYELVCGEGMDSEKMPAPGAAQKARLSYFIRPGKHAMSKVDWDAMLVFADRWLHR